MTKNQEGKHHRRHRCRPLLLQPLGHRNGRWERSRRRRKEIMLLHLRRQFRRQRQTRPLLLSLLHPVL